MNLPILILGRHEGMMQNVRSFLSSHHFTNTKGVLTNDDVRAELLSKQFQVLIIGGGVDVDTRSMIQELIATNGLTIKVIEHYGNPSGLLHEIERLL